MGKYVMVVQSKPKPGRDADYNLWYDTVHLPDMLDVPGVVSGRRFDATPIMMGTPGMAYLSIFDIEVDDPAALLAELGARGADGRLRPSDSYVSAESALWLYAAHVPVG